jgi:hypothetical protein
LLRAVAVAFWAAIVIPAVPASDAGGVYLLHYDHTLLL